MSVRTGLAAALALTLAACAAEPRYPVRPGEPRATLEPPEPAYPVTRPQTPSPPPSPPAAPRPTPPQGQAAGPALRGRQPAASALDIPREATVRAGETLFELAERVRTPVRALIELNHLEPPYDVTPGMTLKVPPPVIYVVQSGDTLHSVSRRFSIDVRSLASYNDISPEAHLRLGQKLALPALAKDTRPPQATIQQAPLAPVKPKPVAAQIASTQTASTQTASTQTAAPAQTALAPSSPAPAPPASAPPGDTEPASAAAIAAGKGRFAWPAKGDILSTYGPKGPGQRNDGVNIAVQAGDPVTAAAAGQVVYAGNSIPGFGNLVVLKHPGGWTSLYANLGKISVKIRAEVAQGQPLGVAGLSGAVDRPQVHFELRYAETPEQKAQPVDPQQLLPAA